MIGTYAGFELVVNVICAVLYRQQKWFSTGPTVVEILSKAWPEGVCPFHKLPAGY